MHFYAAVVHPYRRPCSPMHLLFDERGQYAASLIYVENYEGFDGTWDRLAKAKSHMHCNTKKALDYKPLPPTPLRLVLIIATGINLKKS
jgi:hypothetical protein